MFEIAVILAAHDAYTVYVNTESLRSMYPNSLLGRTLDLDPTASEIEIPNAIVTPKVLHALHYLLVHYMFLESVTNAQLSFLQLIF